MLATPLDPRFRGDDAQYIRHSRERGNPVSCFQRRWVPAFAGTTIQETK